MKDPFMIPEKSDNESNKQYVLRLELEYHSMLMTPGSLSGWRHDCVERTSLDIMRNRIRRAKDGLN